jgi:hypothetical protein
MSKSLIIRDTDDDAISSIDFGITEPGATSASVTIRVYNTGTETPADVVIGCLTTGWNATGDRNSQGQEAVTEKWVQARVGAGAFTAIGGNPLTAGNVLSITPPAPGAYVDVELRQVIPATPTTRGGFSCIPFALYEAEPA